MLFRVLLAASGSGLDCHGCFFGLRQWLFFRRQLFPIASFFNAVVNRSDLGLLLHDEGGAALGARLGDGHVGRSEIAVGIARTAVEESQTPASAFSHACPLHEFAFVALRALDAHGDRTRVLALRIAKTADEFPE